MSTVDHPGKGNSVHRYKGVLNKNNAFQRRQVIKKKPHNCLKIILNV